MAAKGSKGGKKLEVYKKCFKEADKNNDGFLDVKEFKAMLKGDECQCNLTDAEIAETFVFFEGPQGDKRITFEEFSKGLDQIMAFMESLVVLFSELDADKSGFLDKKELKAVLQKSEKGPKMTDAEIDAILKKADVNGDNKIGLDEFLAAFC